LSLPARLCWRLHAKQEVLLIAELVGTLLFVIGCVAFYAPSQYTAGVSLFLVGSLLMLFSVAGRAFLLYGPSR
jgi:drug/metabolite transporter (DMT)-like permease